MNLKDAVITIVKEALTENASDPASSDDGKLAPLLGDSQLDELEEAWATIDPVTGDETWHSKDDDELADLYAVAFDDSSQPSSPKDDRIVAKSRLKQEGDSESWLDHIVSKAKKLALTDVGGPEGVLTPIDRVAQNSTPKTRRGDDFKKWKSKQHANEVLLRSIVHNTLREMKLGVAGGGHFDFSQKDNDDDDDDVTSFLLSKKKEDEAPSPEKSGTKLSTKKHRAKSSQFR